jgi:hypothetical protein
MIFGNKRTLIHILMIFGCIVCMIFYEPLLSNQLISMNVSINNIGNPQENNLFLGYFFLFGTLSYVVFGPIVGIFSKNFDEKRFLTFGALLTTSIALFFFGPSDLFMLP